MKLNFNSLEVKRKINLLAEICHYGIEWQVGLPDTDNIYILGGVETTAHILSCCIVQWFGFESCGTVETRDFLRMETAIDRQKDISIEEWERRITEYLKVGVDCQEN
jgi:hypothetical protein